MEKYVRPSLRMGTLALLFAVNTHTDSVRLSFDNVLPETLYKTVFDGTFQLLDAIALLEQAQTRSEQELVNDLIAGRIFWLQHAIKSLAAQHATGRNYLSEDITYIHTLIAQAADTLQASPKGSSHAIDAMIHALHVLQKQLQTLM
jgi:hypothetical protein